jgi:antitoxin PrlF
MTTRKRRVAKSAPASFEATVTGKGRLTIPKEIRDHLEVRAGGTLRFTLESNKRVIITAGLPSVRRLFGVLGKPPCRATLDEMDEAIRRAVVERYRRSITKAKSDKA